MIPIQRSKLWTLELDLKGESREMKPKKIRLILTFVLLIIFLSKMVDATAKSARVQPTRHHFVLVHGASHGAWCWYKLMALLRSPGHHVTALDLAASGINPKQFYEAKFISDYFQPLRDFMASLPPHERVILVAHSFGGLAISQAMEMFPQKIVAAVFVTASMPGPLLNVTTLNRKSLRRTTSLVDSHYIYGNGHSNPPTAFIFGPKDLSAKVYQRCPSEDLELATTLLRPLYLYSDEDMEKELKLSTRNYGSVRRVFIISREDKLSHKDLQEWMIKKNPPHQVEEIKGSDHMVMMSKPAELLACLLGIAEKYS